MINTYKNSEDNHTIANRQRHFLSISEDKSPSEINVAQNSFVNSFDEIILGDSNVSGDVINQLITFFKQLSEFCSQGASILELPVLKFSKIFNFVSNLNIPEQETNFYIVFVEYIRILSMTCPETDLTRFYSTGFFSAFYQIFKKTKFATTLWKSLDALCHFFDNKLLFCEKLPDIYDIYSDIYSIYFSTFHSSSTYHIIWDYSVGLDDSQQICLIGMSAVEALTNIMIFLPLKMQEIQKRCYDKSPNQVLSLLISFLNGNHFSSPLLKEQLLTTAITLFRKIYNSCNKSYLHNFFTIHLIETFVNIICDYETYKGRYDYDILDILCQISKYGVAAAKTIIKSDFCSYSPKIIHNGKLFYDLLFKYCETLEAIITNLHGPTKFVFAKRQGMDVLKRNSSVIITIVKALLILSNSDLDNLGDLNLDNIITQCDNNVLSQGAENFEVMRCTTMIIASMITSNDPELIMKILNEIPNIKEKLIQTLEEQDPLRTPRLLNAINILIHFLSTKGNKSLQISQELISPELLAALQDLDSTFQDNEEISALVHVILKFSTKGNNNIELATTD
ncbi:hypothetical protein TRFO_22106 [Tritrichomonas foetus]|uniref:Uncharacterized protein n=1 Tax=Tritrichomonas foetus TaxID=1144522 RepID=A0A1J4KCM4_9EUKA|nr:hypothetical protein TRFO_22106 [Tritrichomonas foetus]|eukprot:OHT09175.1 hypothetical protein TRFO_22106 [Tritrichomonas foetus]